MRLRLHFVDGEQLNIAPEEWASVRADGVDAVEVLHQGVVRIAAASLYWLYPENGKWVAGWGSLRYDPNPLTEIVFGMNGQEERQRPWAPDLQHGQVKLGWWWSGTSEPVDG